VRNISAVAAPHAVVAEWVVGRSIESGRLSRITKMDGYQAGSGRDQFRRESIVSAGTGCEAGKWVR